jgi:hypothetical protein
LSKSLTDSIKFGMEKNICINNNRHKRHHARQYYPVKLSCLYTSNIHRMLSDFTYLCLNKDMNCDLYILNLLLLLYIFIFGIKSR